jgi:hypothetical protein
VVLEVLQGFLVGLMGLNSVIMCGSLVSKVVSSYPRLYGPRGQKTSSCVREMMKDNFTEKRSESRKKADEYSCVEFIKSDLKPAHLFVIYNVASTGIGIIVKEGSVALKHLKVGRIMEAKFTLPKVRGGFENCKVEIKHITKDDKGRFKGHYLIGLSILESLAKP